MAFKLGKGSNAKLKGVDKRMAEIVKEAIKIQDAVILQDSLEPLARAVLMFKGVSAKLGQ